MTHNLSPQTDARGVVVSECKPSSLEDYERALYQFQSYFGDPTETLAATVENDPEFVNTSRQSGTVSRALSPSRTSQMIEKKS